MANIINGDFTIKEVLNFTFQSKFKTRFFNKERDVLKKITIDKIKVFDKDRLLSPQIKYKVTTYSYPQYKPYYTGKDKRGRSIRYQRTIRHQYDIILELSLMSIDVPFKWRVGADRKWNFKPSQSQIKSIYQENRRTWSKERIKRHREKKNLYLDVGDYNSRKLGLNGDFFFRLSYVLKQHNMLFGRNYANGFPSKTNPSGIVFFDKHTLRLIEYLMNKGYLT